MLVMLSLEQFAALAAIISAMADMYNIGRDSFSDYLQRRNNAPDYLSRGEILRNIFGTYSDAEVEAIKDRIESCRNRFIAEGSGKNRIACLCSVLNDVKDGNGGIIPVPEWERTHKQLCA
jgi:predicted CopG family antitoxin